MIHPDRILWQENRATILGGLVELTIKVYKPHPIRGTSYRVFIRGRRVYKSHRLFLVGVEDAQKVAVEQLNRLFRLGDFVDFPSHCCHCGVLLKGGDTRHLDHCPFYPISYHGMMAEKEQTKAQAPPARRLAGKTYVIEGAVDTTRKPIPPEHRKK